MRFLIVIIMVSSFWTCSKDRGSTGKNGTPPVEGVMKLNGMTGTGPSVPMGGGGTSAKVTVKGIPSPATLTVLNDTDKSLSFDTTFGTYQPFGVVSLDGSVAPSVLFGPCLCKCGSSCPDSARPLPRKVELAPGKSFSYQWKGLFTLQEKNKGKYGWCCRQVPPVAGRYTVAVCAREGVCAHTDVVFPARGPVVVKMSSTAKAGSCSAVNMKVAQQVARHFVTTRLAYTKKGSDGLCTGKPRCVAPNVLDKELKKARGARCSLFVVPRGKEVEILALIPLGKDAVKGERFSIIYEPSFTKIRRVNYSQ